MRTFVPSFILAIAVVPASAQVLIDSIPYPGVNQSFWGIHVNADTIFLGSDGAGNIHFSDHNGTLLGQQATGFNYCHGLVRKPSSYLIAQDFTTGGAALKEVSLSGGLLNSWNFPPVIGGNSSGIGDLCADGDAVWYTMYYPDFDVYPFAYAYKWIPGGGAPIDTVPLHGEQPYGIALKGDTLFYVTDDLNDDPERIYAYDLSTNSDIGWVELPDTPIDNDMSPRGMFYDGTHLYLIANRQGGNAFAYQTIYKYAFDSSVGFAEASASLRVLTYPNPANNSLIIEAPFGKRSDTMDLRIFDASGALIRTARGQQQRAIVDVQDWPAGIYHVETISDGLRSKASIVVAH
jgi:hypothetical protein